MNLKSDLYVPMVPIVKPIKGRRFEIVHHELTEERLQFAKLRDAINSHRTPAADGQEAGTIVQLKDNDKGGVIVMSDTAMERATNIDLLCEAHGDVLIGGLGLGIVLLALQKMETVTSITVVELHREIVDLVVPQLPLSKKCTIMMGDVFTWEPPIDTKYNTIYMDIWNDLCGDNYDEMKTLRQRYTKLLDNTDRGRWFGCWRYAETKQAHFKFK